MIFYRGDNVKKTNMILLIILAISFIVLLSVFLIIDYAELPEAFSLSGGIVIFIYFLVNSNFKEEVNQLDRNFLFKIKNKSKKDTLKVTDDAEINNLNEISDELYNHIKNKLRWQKFKIMLGILLIVLYIIFVTGGIIYLLDINEAEFSGGEIFFAGCMLILTVYFVSLPYLKSKSRYVEIYKNGVVKNIIEYINVDMKYQQSISEKDKVRIDTNYRKLNLDNYTYVEMNDYTKGIIKDNYEIEIVNMLLKRYDEMIIKGQRRKISREFNRTLVIIDKSFTEQIKILNKNTLKDGVVDNNNAYSMVYFHNKELFDEYFVLDCNPNIKVEEYVKEGFFDFVKNFRKNYGIEFDIIFKDKIYIIFYTEGTIEPKIWGKTVNKEAIYKYYIVNKFMEELVEYLKK